MIIKRKPWLVYDTTDEAREEAWKVAHQEGIKIGEAVNKMLLEYGNLKKLEDRELGKQREGMANDYSQYSTFPVIRTKKDGGLEPLPAPIDKPWWKFWN